MNITRVRQQTVVDQVMHHIKDLIASGGQAPRSDTDGSGAGQGIRSRQIIDSEAIKIFQHLGILESRTKTGTYVCDSSHISTEALTWAILLAKGDLLSWSI